MDTLSFMQLMINFGYPYPVFNENDDDDMSDDYVYDMQIFNVTESL